MALRNIAMGIHEAGGRSIAKGSQAASARRIAKGIQAGSEAPLLLPSNTTADAAAATPSRQGPRGRRTQAHTAGKETRIPSTSRFGSALKLPFKATEGSLFANARGRLESPDEGSFQLGANEDVLPGVVHFLFMLTDELFHPRIWRYFFRDAPTGSYTLWAHCAGQCDRTKLSQLLPEITVVPTVQSRYCLDLVSPMAQLTKYAVAAAPPADVHKFVFISDSTLPVKPFSYVYRNLTATLDSDLCIMNPTTWASQDVAGQRLFVVKHSQWAILNWHHAAKLADKWVPPELGPLGQANGSQWVVPVDQEGSATLPRSGFLYKENRRKAGCADEEAIFAVLFGAYRGVGESYFNGVGSVSNTGSDRQGRCPTFVAWDPTQNDIMRNIAGDPNSFVYKNMTTNNAHPLRIDALSFRAMTILRNTPYLFARKFNLSGGDRAYARIVFSEEPPEAWTRKAQANYTQMKRQGFWCKSKDGFLWSEEKTTLRGCQSLCGEHTQCRYVAYDTDTAMCSLWKSCGSPFHRGGPTLLFNKGRMATYTVQGMSQRCAAENVQEGWLATFREHTLSDCQETCTATYGCEFAVFSNSQYKDSRSTGNCDLFSECKVLQTPPKSFSRIYSRHRGLAYPTFERGYWCGTPSSTWKLASAWGQTLQSCKEQCSGDDACTHFSFDKTTTWCATWSECPDNGKREVGEYASKASYVKVEMSSLSRHRHCVQFCGKKDLRLTGSGCEAMLDSDGCSRSYVSFNSTLVPCMWDADNKFPCHRNHDPLSHFRCHNTEELCHEL